MGGFRVVIRSQHRSVMQPCLWDAEGRHRFGPLLLCARWVAYPFPIPHALGDSAAKARQDTPGQQHVSNQPRKIEQLKAVNAVDRMATIRTRLRPAKAAVINQPQIWFTQGAYQRPPSSRIASSPLAHSPRARDQALKQTSRGLARRVARTQTVAEYIFLIARPGGGSRAVQSWAGRAQ